MCGVTERIMAVQGQFRVNRGRWFGYRSKERMRLPIVINSNLGSLSHRFRDTVAYRSKIANSYLINRLARGNLFQMFRFGGKKHLRMAIAVTSSSVWFSNNLADMRTKLYRVRSHVTITLVFFVFSGSVSFIHWQKCTLKQIRIAVKMCDRTIARKV